MKKNQIRLLLIEPSSFLTGWQRKNWMPMSIKHVDKQQITQLYEKKSELPRTLTNSTI